MTTRKTAQSKGAKNLKGAPPGGGRRGSGAVTLVVPRSIAPDQPLRDIRQEKFCWDLLTMTQTQAMRLNFPECLNWKGGKREIQSRSSKLAQRLAPRIQYLVRTEARKYAEGAERVLWALRAIAQTDLADVVDWDSVELRVEDFASLSAEQRAAIQEIQVERDVFQFDADSEPVEYVKKIRVKMHSKTEALKLLGQYEKLWQNQEQKAPPLTITMNFGPPELRQIEDQPVDVEAEVKPS